MLHEITIINRNGTMRKSIAQYENTIDVGASLPAKTQETNTGKAVGIFLLFSLCSSAYVYLVIITSNFLQQTENQELAGCFTFIFILLTAPVFGTLLWIVTSLYELIYNYKLSKSKETTTNS